MKILGRNRNRPLPEEFKDEIKRVLGAVTYVGSQVIEYPVPVVRGKTWYPFDSVFQETAWNNDYSDIFPELCRINSKVALGGLD